VLCCVPFLFFSFPLRINQSSTRMKSTHVLLHLFLGPPRIDVVTIEKKDSCVPFEKEKRTTTSGTVSYFTNSSRCDSIFDFIPFHFLHCREKETTSVVFWTVRSIYHRHPSSTQSRTHNTSVGPGIPGEERSNLTRRACSAVVRNDTSNKVWENHF